MMPPIEKTPTHPGAILKEAMFQPPRQTQSEMAAILGVSRRTVNQLVNERRGVSAEMALRLAAAFSARTANWWLAQQAYYDLHIARQSVDVSNIKRVF